MPDINERVCRNVKALCVIHSAQLGEVEKQLGKNPGFFSRRCKVSPDMMIQLSDLFKITIDDLVRTDFEEKLTEHNDKKNLSEVIQYLSCRLEKDELMKLVISIINSAYEGSK